MSTWTNIDKYEGQVGLTYNEVGYTYNNANINYWGILVTVFANLTKAVTTFTNLARITNTSFTNQTKN